jgi:hypothetical protein
MWRRQEYTGLPVVTVEVEERRTHIRVVGGGMLAQEGIVAAHTPAQGIPLALDNLIVVAAVVAGTGSVLGHRDWGCEREEAVRTRGRYSKALGVADTGLVVGYLPDMVGRVAAQGIALGTAEVGCTGTDQP